MIADAGTLCVNGNIFRNPPNFPINFILLLARCVECRTENTKMVTLNWAAASLSTSVKSRISICSCTCCRTCSIYTEPAELNSSIGAIWIMVPAFSSSLIAILKYILVGLGCQCRCWRPMCTSLSIFLCILCIDLIYLICRIHTEGDVERTWKSR